MSQGSGASSPPQPNASTFSDSQIRELGAGTYGERELLKMLRTALMIASSAALTLRAPRKALARGSILSSCLKPWKGCPEGGSLSGSRLGVAGFSEVMAMYDGSTSDKRGSTCAPHGENGLARAALGHSYLLRDSGLVV